MTGSKKGSYVYAKKLSEPIYLQGQFHARFKIKILKIKWAEKFSTFYAQCEPVIKLLRWLSQYNEISYSGELSFWFHLCFYKNFFQFSQDEISTRPMCYVNGRGAMGGKTSKTVVLPYPGAHATLVAPLNGISWACSCIIMSFISKYDFIFSRLNISSTTYMSEFLNPNPSET